MMAMPKNNPGKNRINFTLGSKLLARGKATMSIMRNK
jgi:hypothetical protein